MHALRGVLGSERSDGVVYGVSLAISSGFDASEKGVGWCCLVRSMKGGRGTGGGGYVEELPRLEIKRRRYL